MQKIKKEKKAPTVKEKRKKKNIYIYLLIKENKILTPFIGQQNALKMRNYILKYSRLKGEKQSNSANKIKLQETDSLTHS